VVAGEVKHLARQMAKATKDITDQITAAVEEQGAATGKIARNIQQVAHGSSEMASSIGKVSRTVEQTGTSAGHVLQSSDALSRQAQSLGARIHAFLSAVRAA